MSQDLIDHGMLSFSEDNSFFLFKWISSTAKLPRLSVTEILIFEQTYMFRASSRIQRDRSYGCDTQNTLFPSIISQYNKLWKIKSSSLS